MPPPLGSVNNVARSQSMTDILPNTGLGPIGNPQNDNGIQRQNSMGNIGGHANAQNVVNANVDNAVNQVVIQGNGPDPQPGNGQVRQFAANHRVGGGRDWDLNTAKGTLETVQKAVAHIKTSIAGERQFTEYYTLISVIANTEINAHRDAADAIRGALEECKQVMDELKAARAELVAAVKDGSGASDPREGLAEVRKTLRVFRYEMQREFSKRGNVELGRMGFNEGNMRALQHKFTFGVGSNVKATFERVMQLESRLATALSNLDGRIHAVNADARPVEMPQVLKLSSVAGKALELSHQTNDRIRDFQDADLSSSRLRSVVGPIAEKEGSRKVEFSAGIGALIGLGLSTVMSAGVRAGLRFRVVADIKAGGKGRPLSVTFRVLGGLEAKGGVKAGEDSFSAGAKAEAAANLALSSFTTRSYPTLEDFIADADRCKLATRQSVAEEILGGAKALGRGIYSLGKRFFRWVGRRSDDVKQDNAAYLQSLKERGIAGRLDKLLAKRVNPIIVAERKGKTFHMQVEASASINIVKGVAKAGASGKLSHERDFKVDSKAFSPIARIARNAQTAAEVNALLNEGPNGQLIFNVPNYAHLPNDQVYSAIEADFENIIRDGKEVADRSSGLLSRTDTAGFRRVANRLRTLLIVTELSCRNNKLTREEADRLLERYSNPPFKFPRDVFRDYLMVNVGLAKPAKVRNSASVTFKVGLFSDWSDELTGGIGNAVLKAVADGAVDELRHQAGLDTSFGYRFSSEKPVKKDDDPRPWENCVKTTHELAISASMPVRILLDAITRSVVNKGERIENRSTGGKVAKDTFKGVVADGAKDAPTGAVLAAIEHLLVAGVKEAAVPAVKKWLANSENAQKLIDFLLTHSKDTFESIIKTLEWASEHSGVTLQAAASIAGSSGSMESERSKVISWSFVDGELNSIAVFFESTSKIGFNVDPVGVGVGVGFDLSYSVADSVKERSVTPRPTLTMLMDKGADYLFGETGLKPFGGGADFKKWLAKNANGVAYMLAKMRRDQTAADDAERLYDRAREAAAADAALQLRLDNAWDAVRNLAAGATLDAKVDAVHDLVTAMVLSYRLAAQAAE